MESPAPPPEGRNASNTFLLMSFAVCSNLDLIRPRFVDVGSWEWVFVESKGADVD